MTLVPFQSHEVQKWTGGEQTAGSPDTRLAGTSIDTRSIHPGELFVAIRGQNYDAHGFLDKAVESGAAALLVQRDWLKGHDAPSGPDIIAVEDTTRALGALARGHRQGFSGPVVAITGSNGKTSTKELTYSILSNSQPCLKNEGNLNNEFGLPLTLLRRETEHRAAVVEMGMNHRGEIARLVEIASPTVGLITNVGTAHIEYLGSQEEIALEKGDLVAGLGPNATAVLNADDARVLAQRERGPERVLTFGRKGPADIQPEQIRFETEGTFVFRLCTPLGSGEVRVHGWAETTVENALAAAAAAVAAGATLEQIQQGLDGFTAVPGRMQHVAMEMGAHVLDDTYNANPQSVRNALETLQRVKAGGRSIAVLGDMGELGDEAVSAHREIGRFTAQTETDLLFVIGGHAGEVAGAAMESGMPKENVSICEQPSEIAQEIASLATADDWILVKGSRSMKMERIVQQLTSGGAH